MTNVPFNGRPGGATGGFGNRPHRSGEKPSFRRDGGRNYIRKNDKIRAREVRVIGHDGGQLGIMFVGDAIALAKSKGFDLVEISPNAQPPVCKILDFGKYKYDECKRSKQGAKVPSSRIKEVKLRVAIDQNDYSTKIRHSIEFLEKGFKLKVSLMFRGRELSHSEIGFELIKRFTGELGEYSTLDSEPKLFGKIISATLSPIPAQKRSTQAHKKQPQPTKILDASELLKL
ncbi:MAG: translation initiation factor IF-3 [Puniceicoccales bacterium]|jgi:translation initiation factor IF-3|nr:translation initiation factor IF-3 [Puniceicoccales bacterium]